MNLKSIFLVCTILIVVSINSFSTNFKDTNAPVLVYNAHIIDDDNEGSSNGDDDGVPESSESIELPVSIINTGDIRASSVSAILICTDSDIIITDNSESYGDIEPGAVAWCNYAYDFTISSSCPDKTVEFTLNISSNEGSWTSSFSIDISNLGSPDLVYATHIIDDDASGSSNGDGDGIPEAGETVEFPVLLHNNGILTATGISATISTTDTDINISDPFEYYADIQPGNSGWCNNDYDIDIADNCPEKDVLFTIEIEADQGFWTDSFIIHISEQGLPTLQFDEFIIDDDLLNNSFGNDNGMAEPGEHIELPVSILNIGDANATNVSAVLSTNDPYINVNDPNENYGNIMAGTSKWSNNEFDFIINENCPDKDVLFTLIINSTEGSWTSNFIVHVYINGSPNLEYANLIIDDDNNGTSNGDDDGEVEPGEKIELPLSIINTGTAASHSVVGTLSCADPDITITDANENFGTILPGEEKWSAFDFDFTVNYGTAEKDISFTLNIQSTEGEWNDLFTIHVYPASGVPNLSYANHIIDDDDVGTSNGNDDGIPAAGESIELPLQITNTGTLAAHNVSAVLSCSDPDITITDANENFDDLNIGDLAWTHYAYDFDISPSCPDKIVTFNLLISATEGSWNSSFSISITGAGTPQLVFTGYIIDDDQSGESYGDSDGLAEPGESIELPVLISNIGDGPANNVHGVLSTNDPDIILTDEFENFGDINENSDAWTANDFDFDISESCPEKDVVFTLTLEGDEGIWTTNFTIHITPLVYYEVMSFPNPTNGGVTDGDGVFAENETCTLTATSLEGFQFINWTHNGVLASSLPEYSFPVTENTVLIANFSVNEYVVNVDAFPVTGGTVTGEGLYQYNETATVTASPNANYVFVEWTINGQSVSTNTSYSFVVTEETTLTAHFQGEQYIIQASANPSNGGSISGDGEYENGETAILSAFPNDGFNFINWTENGTVVSSNANYSFVVHSNRTLIAHFSEEFFVIDAAAIPEDGGPIEGTGIYADGQYATLSTIPNNGFYFIDWKENGITVSTNINYQFQVTQDRFIEAYFGIFDYEITVVANPPEAGSVSGGGNFNYNDEVTVLAIANSGWEFLSWTSNNTVVSNDAEYTFNISESMNLQANFIVQEFTITVFSTPGYGGSASGDGLYNYGETANLIAQEANDYNFLYWMENNDVVSNNAEYSFTVIQNRELTAVFELIDGINQYEANTNSIYPNPTNGIVFIHLVKESELEIFDGKGLIVNMFKLNKGVSKIDLSTQAKGLYYLRIISVDKIEILKIMKE